MAVDPVTVQLLRNRVASVMEEMDFRFYRSGYSTIVRESRDFSCVIVDRQGRLLVAPWMFFHAPVYYHLVGRILEIYGADGLENGDVIVCNHPYEGNMPHVSDMAVVTPIFHGGSLVAFAGSIAHKADVGGTVPGSTNGQATEMFQEGMLLPPLKLHRGGEPDSDVERLIAANTRAPGLVLGDLSGQIGAIKIGSRQIVEMCERFGGAVVVDAFDDMIRSSGEEFRAALARLPDGVGEAEGYLDHDGIDTETPVRLAVRVTVKDGRPMFDFSGTHPRTKGPTNLRIGLIEACVYYVLIGMLDPDLRYSDAIRDLVGFEFGDNTVANARPPAPVSSYMKTCQKLIDVLLEALDPFLPGRAIANSGGSGGSIIVAWKGNDGIRKPRANQYEIFGSAYGASPVSDGASGASVHLANLFIAPVEIIESEFPCRINRFELVPDSGGAGEFRGGLSFVREYNLEAPATVVYRSDRAIVPPAGLAGGRPGGKSRFVLAPGTPDAEVMPSSCRLDLEAGTTFSVQGAGSGGYGDPARRAPERLERDLEEGYVTQEGARGAYAADEL
jgi:N-methylhydantoinase B